MEYIGEREIKGFSVDEGGNTVNVEFTDGGTTKMSGTLFFHLKTEEQGKGTVTDNVNHYFAKQFLAELAEHDLEYYFIENIGMAMRVLAHNLREEAIKKAFNCTGGDAISLQKLILNQ